MGHDEFSDAALVLVGHGSLSNTESSAPVYKHADELRRRGMFAQVLECFWKIEPSIAGVVGGVCSRRVFVVPVFISEGYFTEEIIPREVGLCAEGQKDFARVQARGSQTIYYCGPIGTHDSMTEVLLARAKKIVDQYPFPRPPKLGDTALFIAGHGTTKNENSRKAIERQVELIRARNLYAEVHPAFMEEDPRIAECYRMTPAKNMVMVPFFISDGLHSREEIPVLLGESKSVVQTRLKSGQLTWRNPTEKNGKRVWYSASVGSEPRIAEVVLERVRERAREQGSRGESGQ